MNKSYTFFKNSEIKVALNAGKTLLGIPKQELGKEYLDEMDKLLTSFEPYLQKDVHTLFKVLNLRILSLFLVTKLTPFSSLSDDLQIKYIKKFIHSKIPLLRTMHVTIKAIAGWSYYSLQKCWEEMEFPGETIGHEYETPTLLYGKTPKEGDF